MGWTTLVPTAAWQGLTRLEAWRLLHAVQALRVRRGTGTEQGLRNHALLAALLGSGLRVSEILNLERDQYTGKGFSRVQTKGGVMRDFVSVHRDARKILDEWLKERQDTSHTLFMMRTGRKLSRREAYGIVLRVAAQANAHLPEDEKIDVSPPMCCAIPSCASLPRPRGYSMLARPPGIREIVTSGAT
jgi:site-specific recombinase XerD